MKLVVNGSERDVGDVVDVRNLIELLKLDPKSLVVEHNGEILRREQFENAKLTEGDRVELVRFVGGG
jgi:thiamine biosynthesis protein ThiS